MFDLASIFALFVISLMFFGIVAAIVVLGMIPGKIARKRNHPQVDAINAASWVGLALLGIGWPIAFVWAFTRVGEQAQYHSDTKPGAAA